MKTAKCMMAKRCFFSFLFLLTCMFSYSQAVVESLGGASVNYVITSGKDTLNHQQQYLIRRSFDEGYTYSSESKSEPFCQVIHLEFSSLGDIESIHLDGTTMRRRGKNYLVAFFDEADRFLARVELLPKNVKVLEGLGQTPYRFYTINCKNIPFSLLLQTHRIDIEHRVYNY